MSKVIRPTTRISLISGPFDFKGKAAARDAADVEKFSGSITQQPRDYRLGFFAIHNYGVDHVVLRIVGADDAPLAKVRRVNVPGSVSLAGVFMDENRSALRIRMAWTNRSVRKQDHSLTRVRPPQTMTARRRV